MSLSIQSFIRGYFLPLLRKFYEDGREDVKWFKVLDTFIRVTLQFFTLYLCAGEKEVYTCLCMPLQYDFSNSQRKIPYRDRPKVSLKKALCLSHHQLVPPPHLPNFSRRDCVSAVSLR